MNPLKRLRLACVLAAGLALGVPAVAAAHPSVYAATAKIAKTAAKQTITITGSPTGGTFKPSAAATPVAFDGSAAAVEAALQADPAIGYGGVAVSGSAGGPYAVMFIGPLAGVAQAALAADGSALIGGTAAAADAAVVQSGGATVTSTGDPVADQAAMAGQLQYVITNDGYTIAYRETNGIGPDLGPGIVTGEGRGMLNLSKVLPSGYRATMTALQKLAYGAAQTGVQPHATCTGVAALRDPDTIWAWQTRADNDPFYDYIPWQKGSAGLGDDPAKWIATVKTVTGVDLATLSSVQDFTSACTGLGGSYHPADTASSVTTAVVADAVTAATAPLTSQISVFTTKVGDLTGQIAALTATNGKLTSDNAALTAANQALAGAQPGAPAVRKLALTLASRKIGTSSLATLVTGTAGRAATVKLTVGTSVARALGLRSTTLAKTTKKIDGQGAALITVAISKTTAKALRKVKGSVPVTATATSGSETSTAKASLTT
jgi:hypothetical protein